MTIIWCDHINDVIISMMWSYQWCDHVNDGSDMAMRWQWCENKIIDFALALSTWTNLPLNNFNNRSPQVYTDILCLLNRYKWHLHFFSALGKSSSTIPQISMVSAGTRGTRLKRDGRKFMAINSKTLFTSVASSRGWDCIGCVICVDSNREWWWAVWWKRRQFPFRNWHHTAKEWSQGCENGLSGCA